MIRNLVDGSMCSALSSMSTYKFRIIHQQTIIASRVDMLTPTLSHLFIAMVVAVCTISLGVRVGGCCVHLSLIVLHRL